MTSDGRIASVQSWACSIALEQPLSFGAFTVASREYTAVRVTTSGGLHSDCLGLSRRAPVDIALLDVIAPVVVGRDALDLSDRMHDIRQATRAMDADGIMARARSLLEICLSDLRAQAAGLPLWRLLGGHPRPLPVLLVEGYPLPEESDDAFARRLAARADEGYRAIKIEASSYADPEQLERRLAALRRLIGDRMQIVVDMAWAWGSAREGIRQSQAWSQHPLAWIEDPLPRDLPQEIARLRSASAHPIACGDEATRPGELRELLDADAVDLLRLDATTIGGLGAALHLADMAAALGKGASLHVHPEIHQHCALARPIFQHLEAFPLDRPFDCAHQLLQTSVFDNVRDGIATAPKGPGSGLRLDIAAVREAAYREGVVHDAGS